MSKTQIIQKQYPKINSLVKNGSDDSFDEPDDDSAEDSFSPNRYPVNKLKSPTMAGNNREKINYNNKNNFNKTVSLVGTARMKKS